MSKKILGFRKKDTDEFKRYIQPIIGETDDDRYHIKIRVDKLVPVVSIKWLEDVCKKKFIVVFCNKKNKLEKVIDTSILLSEARKQAGVQKK